MNKKITVYFNSVPKEVEKRDYKFEDVVEIAVGSYDQAKAYTMVVTLKNDKGEKHKREYSLGDKIKMKEDMRINVESTIRS